MILRGKRPSPNNSNPNLVSRWLKDFFLYGIRNDISSDDLYATNTPTLAKPTGHMFEEWWDQEQQQAKPSLIRLLIKKYGCSVMLYSLAFSLTETMMR